MKHVVIALVTTLGLSGVAGSASADPALGPPRGDLRESLLERFDRNQDGRLEPQERRRAIRVLRNMARRLAMQERFRRDGRTHKLRRLDIGGDGAIGPGELPPAMARKLRRFDANGDGAIEPRELPDRARKLRRLDVNGDGVLGPGELPPAMARKLRRFDANGDGVIAPGELPDRARKLRRPDASGDVEAPPGDTP